LLLGSLAVAALVAWVAAFCAAALGLWPSEAAATRNLPGIAAVPSLAPSDAGAPPAVLSLVAHGGSIDGRAYAATVLDLAARGHLRPSTPKPGELWLSAPATDPGTGVQGDGLTAYEQPVLTQVRQRALGHGAPFQVLADTHAANIPGAWTPFEQAVRSAAKQAGLTREFIPRWVRFVLMLGLLAIGALAWASLHAQHHSQLRSAIFLVTILAAFVPFRAFTSRDRVTRAGSALAVAATSAATRNPAAPIQLISPPSPADLRTLADALAIGAPLPLDASAASARAMPPGASGHSARRLARLQGKPGQPPGAAWSSFSGQWRMVRIGPPPGRVPRADALMTSMVCFFWVIFLGFIAFVLTGVLPAPYLPLAYLLAVALAAYFGTLGFRGVRAWVTRKREFGFEGQVIARWEVTVSDEDSSWQQPHIAVDDGRRGWNLIPASPDFDQLGLGDRVHVQVLMQSGQLVSIHRLVSDITQPAP
jgi:Predicted membrane protein (DUF2207)